MKKGPNKVGKKSLKNVCSEICRHRQRPRKMACSRKRRPSFHGDSLCTRTLLLTDNHKRCFSCIRRWVLTATLWTGTGRGPSRMGRYGHNQPSMGWPEEKYLVNTLLEKGKPCFQ